MFKKDERLLRGTFHFKTPIIHTVNLSFLNTQRHPSVRSRFRPASVSPCSKKEIIVKYGKDNGSERMECTATVR